MSAAADVLRNAFEHRRLLVSTTRMELMKRYAGSMLGFLWVFLNPLLFLSVYVFLYLVVFRTSWPDTTAVGYTVFVFAGLVPFLAFMEVANGSVGLIRSNVQDFAMGHVSHKNDAKPDGSPLRIGNYVTIGHSVILHGCEIGDECLVFLLRACVVVL